MFWLPLARLLSQRGRSVVTGSGGPASGDCELNGPSGTLLTVVTANGCLVMLCCGLRVAVWKPMGRRGAGEAPADEKPHRRRGRAGRTYVRTMETTDPSRAVKGGTFAGSRPRGGAVHLLLGAHRASTALPGRWEKHAVDKIGWSKPKSLCDVVEGLFS
jgi:hypothetical protein